MPYLSNPKLLLTLLLALTASYANSQQPNPFKSIGKKAEFIDISKGKYVEIIEKDSLERIGSVLVNRYTRKIERLLDETVIGAEEDNTVQSRFFSVDPIASQFPELSPYHFAGNTPIQAVDLDGREPQGFMEYWKAVSNEYPTKYGYSVQDFEDYKTKQVWTVMHYPNTNEYYYWQTKNEGANRLFVPQNTGLNRQENQWTGLFKQFTPTHLSDDRSFHYFMVGMLTSPFVAMGAIEGTAAASNALSNYGAGVVTQAVTKGIMYYYRYAPAAGVAGRTLAEIFDESGAVGAQNSGLRFFEQATLQKGGELLGGFFKFVNKSGVAREADFLANYIANGKTLELTDAALYIRGVSNEEGALEMGTKGTLSLLDELKKYAKEQGFEELKITFKRTEQSSSKNPGHSYEKVFNLNE